MASNHATASPETGSRNRETKRDKETLNGRFVDTRIHDVDRKDFEERIIKSKREASGVVIKLKIRGTTERHDVDINQIAQQGMKIPIFRCPKPECLIAFPRRGCVARHVSKRHSTDVVNQGDNWRGHVTCNTFEYGEFKPGYRRKSKDEIESDKLKNASSRSSQDQPPTHAPAAQAPQPSNLYQPEAPWATSEPEREYPYRQQYRGLASLPAADYFDPEAERRIQQTTFTIMTQDLPWVWALVHESIELRDDK